VKITPLDIRRKEFKRSMRGYSDEEVDIFLDEVADEFERLFQENIELQDRVKRVEEQIATYAQVRDALEKTLVSAQLQSEEIKANALRESELILRDAQLKARSIVNDSYGETQQVQKALVGLKRLEEEFRFKFRSLLEGYLNLLNEAPITTTTVVGDSGLGSERAAEPMLTDQTPASPAAAPQTALETEGPAEPSPEQAEEIPTEETVLAAAVAEALDEVVAPAEPVEAVSEVEAVVEEAVTGEVVSQQATAAAGVVAEAGAVVTEVEAVVEEAAAETTETEETTMETSPGSPRPEDDQTTLDDSRHGFFFGRQLEDIDDTFPGEDVIRKDRTRDFEW